MSQVTKVEIGFFNRPFPKGAVISAGVTDEEETRYVTAEEFESLKKEVQKQIDLLNSPLQAVAPSELRETVSKASFRLWDQSVFDGKPPEVVCAAKDENGRAFVFRKEPIRCLKRRAHYVMSVDGIDNADLGYGFDGVDWQNSLLWRKDVAPTAYRLWDQSVFDGLDPKYVFAARDANGEGWAYTIKPKQNGEAPYHYIPLSISRYSANSYQLGEGFDPKEWRDSVITRETEQGLKGSGLCRHMLDSRPTYAVPCWVSDVSDEIAKSGCHFANIVNYKDGSFYEVDGIKWRYAVPVKIELLTLEDVNDAD